MYWVQFFGFMQGWNHGIHEKLPKIWNGCLIPQIGSRSKLLIWLNFLVINRCNKPFPSRSEKPAACIKSCGLSILVHFVQNLIKTPQQNAEVFSLDFKYF